MKTAYWILAFILFIGLMAYGTMKDANSRCDPPQAQRRFLQ
ncbi:hypothetical protein [Pseudomonas sp. Y5-11]|jgi:hypothetical protein|nr:hypothetical protein [Pseudomonas sp. Y5-11]